MAERMEFSPDGEDTWQGALSESLPGDVYRQWRCEFDLDGTNEVVVGSMDAEWPFQPEDRWEPFPSVAIGRVRKTVG